MAVATVHSDFGALKKKICHCFHFTPSVCHEVMGKDAMVLFFWIFSFKPVFSFSSLTFTQRLFSSSLLSYIRVVSSAFRKLLIFLLAILIPAWDSSSLAFRIMYPAWKLSMQGDNIKPQHTPFPILNQSIVPCPVLTCFLTWTQISQETGKVVWYSVSLRISHSQRF